MGFSTVNVTGSLYVGKNRAYVCAERPLVCAGGRPYATCATMVLSTLNVIIAKAYPWPTQTICYIYLLAVDQTDEARIFRTLLSIVDFCGASNIAQKEPTCAVRPVSTNLAFDIEKMSEPDMEKRSMESSSEEWKPQKRELVIMISLSFTSLMVALDASILVTVLPVSRDLFAIRTYEPTDFLLR